MRTLGLDYKFECGGWRWSGDEKCVPRKPQIQKLSNNKNGSGTSMDCVSISEFDVYFDFSKRYYHKFFSIEVPRPPSRMIKQQSHASNVPQLPPFAQFLRF
jgi:hypothetical protein